MTVEMAFHRFKKADAISWRECLEKSPTSR